MQYGTVCLQYGRVASEPIKQHNSSLQYALRNLGKNGFTSTDCNTFATSTGIAVYPCHDGSTLHGNLQNKQCSSNSRAGK
jgi:hypothetical protein